MFSEDVYVLAIAALLPLTALMLVLQVNPYNALVIRGILGAIAALVYALFGAADVALTEALVGTMLSITLYAVAVRSSMSMRLGVLATEPDSEDCQDDSYALPEPLLSELRQMLGRHHMRLERMTYPSLPALCNALANKDIHAICIETKTAETGLLQVDPTRPYHIRTRLKRLYDLMQKDIPSTVASLSYAQPNLPASVAIVAPDSKPSPVEGQL
ncbi:MAG: DUF4040 domain-containing protein [Okeania sp. SIO3C4]|nr:DUF4040 domain-containing protein [Okeania sp. SIO3C4]